MLRDTSLKYFAIILILLVIFIGGYVGMRYYKTVQQNALQQLTPDRLQITWPEDKIDKLSALSQANTDQKKIKQLYDAIFMLPTSNRSGSCPVGFFSEYTLDFYKNNQVVLHAVLKPTGCASVQLNSGETKDALYKNGQAFIKNVQETMALTDEDFYGYQVGKLR